MICEGGQSSLNHLLHVGSRQNPTKSQESECLVALLAAARTRSQGRPRALLLILGMFHTRQEELARNDIDT